VAFRQASTHILARELTEEEIRKSLVEGRAYVAHDWLCDPTGFTFVASNNLGVFDMGDQVPLQNNTRIEARLPIPAKLKLIHKGQVLHQATADRLVYSPKEEGPYRLEAWLTVDGEDRPWIFANPIFFQRPEQTRLPGTTLAENVEVKRDLPYIDDGLAKHKLDLYLPKDKTKFPVFVFIHGGAWRSGDRSLYTALGNRFAKAGIGVVIPSYRLMPADPHPAQIEDVAAAFAWVYKSIAAHGGDIEKIYLGGHSAGGHLSALLALHPGFLKKHDVPASVIKGVAALSGVYDMRGLANFGDDASRRDASPINHVQKGAPRFLVTYCQWDYPSLPLQARQFAETLKKSFVATELVYVPNQSHISEIVNIWMDGDITAEAVLRLIQGQ
jgi:acetyl esterase/lipase